MSEIRTIIVKDYSHNVVEVPVDSSVKPGMGVNLGSYYRGTPYAYIDGLNQGIALEDSLQGKGVNDMYKEGQKVKVWIPQRGDVAYVRSSAHDWGNQQEAIFIDGQLELPGTTPPLHTLSAIVLETVNATDGQLIKVLFV